MKTTQRGAQAEQLVVDFLVGASFHIVARNWKTRWCEIDIIAEKQNTLYFIEVKYRNTDAFGSGFEYITDRKLKQMQFAAEFWMKQHSYAGDCTLAAAQVAGDAGSVEFIDVI